MEPLVLKRSGCTYPIRLHICSYQTYGNLAIEMEALINGEWGPWNTLTVNITPRFGPNFALIDTNNNGEEIMTWLTENGLGVPTIGWERSGYCIYPEFMFFEKKLREISESEYETHLRGWNQRIRPMEETK